MKILTNKKQQEALMRLDLINQAIVSGDQVQILLSLEQINKLIIIIGGLGELTKRCKI